MHLNKLSRIDLLGCLVAFACQREPDDAPALQASDHVVPEAVPKSAPEEPTKAQFLHSAMEKEYPEFASLTARAEREQWIREHGANDAKLAHVLGWYAFALKQSGDAELALEFTDLGLLAAETYVDTDPKLREDPTAVLREELLALAHLSKGDIYHDIGEFRRALEHHQLALEYLTRNKQRRAELELDPLSGFERLSAEGGSREYTNLNRIARDHFALGDFVAEGHFQRRAYESIRESENIVDYATMRMYEASTLRREEGPEAALAQLETSIHTVFEEKLPLSPVSVVGPLDSMIGMYRYAAMLAYQAKQIEKARAHIASAIELDRRKQLRLSLAEDLIRKAFLAVESNDPDAARLALDEATSLIPPEKLEPTIRYMLANVEGKRLLLLYQREGRLEDLRASADHLESALAVRDGVDSSRYFSHEQSDLGMDPADDVIRVNYELFTAGERAAVYTALQLAERESGQFSLRSRGANTDAWMPLLPFQYSVKLQEMSNQYAELLDDRESDDPDRQKQAMEATEQLLVGMEQLRTKIKADLPRIGYMIDPSPLDVRETHDVLEEGDVMIRYYRTNTELFTWVISRDAIHWTRNAVRSDDFEVVIDHINKAVTAFAPLDEAARLRLSKTLLGPLSSVDGEIRRLLIVPHSSVEYVPFDLLAVPGPDGLERAHYLVERWPVLYAPSISTWMLAHAAAAKVRVGPPRLLGIADSQTTNTQLEETGYPSGTELPALPAARREIDSIAALFAPGPAKLLIGEQATETTLRHLFLTDYDFIHIATHGLVARLGSTVQPVLLMTPTAQDDGIATLAEITGLLATPYLTVLSACESGAGPYRRASGVVSLATGFLIAGSDNVLATRWPIDDNTTVLMMERFYAEIHAGVRPSVALQRAKLWLMTLEIDADPRSRGVGGLYPSQTSMPLPADSRGNPVAEYPYFWAGFSVYGGDLTVDFVAPSETAPLGSVGNPIKTYSPAGQREYIERLRCADGLTPTYERLDNIGIGVHGNIVDHYRLSCSDQNTDVYMDLYFPGYRERRPVPGFSLADSRQ